MGAVVAVARKRHQSVWRRKSGMADHLGSFSPSSNSRKNIDGRSEAKSASTTPQTPKRGRKKSRAIWIKRKAAPLSSDLWAGPAYAISPPPSSLPTPNFSLGERRSSSFSLSKSAPRESTSSASGLPSCHTDSATETLRRILNLDTVADQKECSAEKVLTHSGGA